MVRSAVVAICKVLLPIMFAIGAWSPAYIISGGENLSVVSASLALGLALAAIFGICWSSEVFARGNSVRPGWRTLVPSGILSAIFLVLLFRSQPDWLTNLHDAIVIGGALVFFPGVDLLIFGGIATPVESRTH